MTGSGGGLEDWGCGTKTYDGHRGTDMGVGSFPGMDAGRDLVAAALDLHGVVNRRVELRTHRFDRDHPLSLEFVHQLSVDHVEPLPDRSQVYRIHPIGIDRI